MIDKSMYNWKEQLLSSVSFGVPAAALFRALLFRCLPGWTLQATNRLFFGLLIGGGLFLSLGLFRWKRGSWTATVSVLLPLGLFTALSYADAFPWLLRGSLIAAAALSAVYAVLLLSRKIPGHMQRFCFRIYKNRCYRCLCFFSSALTIGLTAVMAVMLVHCLFGASLLTASVQPLTGSAVQAQTAEDEASALFREDKWKTLSVHQKLDALQVIANSERSYFGLPHELNVTAGNLEENVYGFYQDSTHTIQISLAHLASDPAREVLRTLYHEAYHAYQHRLADQYNALSPEEQKLRLYARAAYYADELRHYQDGTEDFLSYYTQYCERDSRTYADNSVEYFYAVLDDGDALSQDETAGQEEVILSEEQRQQLEKIKEKLARMIVEYQYPRS